MTPQHEDKSVAIALEELGTLSPADLRRAAAGWTDTLLVELLALVQRGPQSDGLVRQNVVTKPKGPTAGV
jgi:hypothetical protein